MRTTSSVKTTTTDLASQTRLNKTEYESQEPSGNNKAENTFFLVSD